MARQIKAQNSRLAATFAARLRIWRELRRIPLKTMAAELGVSISVISAWENGSRFPTLAHLESLSQLTGMPVSKLLQLEEGDFSDSPKR